MQAVFGAKAQVFIGAACFILGILAWIYGVLVVYPLTFPPERVAFVFHISMFFGLAACYAIVATGLGYRATERVEAQVADVQHADKVEVNEGVIP